MRDHFRRTGLAWVVGVLFLLSFVGHYFTTAANWLDEAGIEQNAHDVWDASRDSDFQEFFWMEVFANWQSEWLQVLTFVILTTFLYYKLRSGKVSAESKDPDES